MNKLKILTHFLPYLKRYWIKETLLLFLMLIASIGSLISPYILKIIIDKVFPNNDYMLLVQILIILFLINVCRVIINFCSEYLFSWISCHITQDIRMSLFEHLMKLPISYFDKTKEGDIIHRISSEVNSIQNILTGTCVRLLNSLCTIIGLTVILCVLNYKLFMISILVMPIIFINTRIFQPKIQKNIKSLREKDADILSYLMECFANVKLIKIYLRYPFEKSKLDKKISDQIVLDLKNIKLTSTTKSITSLLSMAIPILILYIGGKDVISGVMTIGSLVAFVQYINRIYEPFRSLMGLYFDGLKAIVSMERVFDIYNIKEENIISGIQLSSMKNNIVLKDIWFKYEDVFILKNFNYTFKYGKKYALVGKSGCGKSTIASLLCRFYEIQQGSIFIGNIDISKVNINSLRSQIALVTQENQLFHDKIINNLFSEITDENRKSIEHICEITEIKSHIDSLPEGFNASVGDRGTGLSGGQKQRIAIARAIIKNAGIIILDESTSALDSENEKKILDNIYDLYTNKTVIVISHRLSAIRDMDEIICLDDGKIVENGNHEKLIKQKGLYWRLFKEQIE